MEMTMKVLIAAAAAVAAIAAAGTAAAQPYGYGGPYGNSPYGYGQDRFGRAPSSGVAQRFAQRIDEGARSGALTDSEARSLFTRLETTRQLEMRYGRDGYISPSEARALDSRWASLDRRLFAELNDRQYRNGYGYGYGYNDRYNYYRR
jgi:opacity protein-like surface antigen